MRKRSISSENSDKSVARDDAEQIQIEANGECKQGEQEKENVPINKKIMGTVTEYIQKCMQKSSLPGLQYIGEEGRGMPEKLWWIGVLALSVQLCYTHIGVLQHKLSTQPLVKSPSYRPTGMWELPFPALTICPKIKCRKDLFDYTHQLRNENRTENEEVFFQSISLLCNRIYEDENYVTDESAIEAFYQVRPKFSDIFFKCRMLNSPWDYDCAKYFSEILTSEGLCYSYNMFDGAELFGRNVSYNSRFFRAEPSSEWSLETGYSNNESTVAEYPRRTYTVGTKGGITFLLNAYEHDYDFECLGLPEGFKIWLHNPYELPEMKEKFLVVPINQEITISIKPEQTLSSNKINQYDISKRHCFFQGEKELRFFQIYTPENCEMECTTNYTLEKCGCVAFYMPHLNDTPICGRGARMCLKDAIKEWQEETSRKFPIPDDPYDNYELPLNNCICLPSCNSISYNTQISQTALHWNKYPKIIPKKIKIENGTQVTRVRILYQNSFFVPWIRAETYGKSDFIADSGGLLSLYVGFTYVATLEFLYFGTMRILGNVDWRNIIPLPKFKMSKEKLHA